ncbi:hypothetical protein GE118_01920 [Mycoplasma sp. NEAQ87857]|nr:hypothetical protein GE118_01920 [Mycoplasma sp. NEAQ87857]
MEIKHILEEKDKVIAFERPKKSLNLEIKTEKELEDNLINNLIKLGYEYAKDIKTVQQLEENLKIQMQKLNNITFSKDEWKRFCDNFLLNKNHNFIQKTELLQKQGANRYTLIRDDNSAINLVIIDKNNLYKNTLQVINQFNVNP